MIWTFRSPEALTGYVVFACICFLPRFSVRTAQVESWGSSSWYFRCISGHGCKLEACLWWEISTITVLSNKALSFFPSFPSFLHCCILFIRVSAEVKYKKQPWGLVKSVIEKNTWGGIQENFKQLGEAFSSFYWRGYLFSFVCFHVCQTWFLK